MLALVPEHLEVSATPDDAFLIPTKAISLSRVLAQFSTYHDPVTFLVLPGESSQNCSILARLIRVEWDAGAREAASAYFISKDCSSSIEALVAIADKYELVGILKMLEDRLNELLGQLLNPHAFATVNNKVQELCVPGWAMEKGVATLIGWSLDDTRRLDLQHEFFAALDVKSGNSLMNSIIKIMWRDGLLLETSDTVLIRVVELFERYLHEGRQGHNFSSVDTASIRTATQLLKYGARFVREHLRLIWIMNLPLDNKVFDLDKELADNRQLQCAWVTKFVKHFL